MPWGWLWFDPTKAASDETRAGRGWPEDLRYWDSVYETAPILNIHRDVIKLVKWREALFFR